LDALLAAVVMHPALAVTEDQGSRAIGRRCRGRTPGAALDGLDAEVIARHGRSPVPEGARGIADPVAHGRTRSTCVGWLWRVREGGTRLLPPRSAGKRAAVVEGASASGGRAQTAGLHKCAL